MRERHGERPRKFVGRRQDTNGRYASGEFIKLCSLIRRVLQGKITCKRAQIGVTGAQLITTHLPMNGAVQLVEMHELVEAADTAFRDFAGIIDVQAVDRRIEARIGPSGESIKILYAQQL